MQRSPALAPSVPSSQSRVRWQAFAASLLVGTFALGVCPTDASAATRTAGACNEFVGSSGVSLVEGVAIYLPKSNRANYNAVATDLKDVLVEIAKRDSRFKGYVAGQIEDRLLVPKPKKIEQGIKPIASAALFSFGKRPEAGMILVCHTSGEKVTIAADGQAAAHLPVLRSIATNFLKADRIAAAGETIWPPKKGFKP